MSNRLTSLSCRRSGEPPYASPRNLPRHHGLTVHGKGCGEPWTAELPDDVNDARIVGGLTDCPAQVSRVKLPVVAGCGLDPGQQFLLSRIERFLRRWTRLRAGYLTRRRAPPAHEAKQEARRHPVIAPQPIEGKSDPR